jgi:hypothetical protein
VARAAEADWNQGDPEGSRRTNYEGQGGIRALARRFNVEPGVLV